MSDKPMTADGHEVEVGDELFDPTAKLVWVLDVVSVDSNGVYASRRCPVDPSRLFASLTKAHEAHDALREIAEGG